MANYVKISVVGPGPPADPAPDRPREAVDRMIDHWRGELGQVLPDRPDLIVVPEMCDRFSNHTPKQQRAYFEARGCRVRDFFADVARDNRCHVAYSSGRGDEAGRWFNSTQILGRDGRVLGVYDKNHPTIPEATDGGVQVGVEAPLIECDFGRVACAICFDLNFDELRRQYVDAGPDLIVFCSMYHGGLMQAYWAYSCRAHFAGAIAGLPCAILNPVGQAVARSTNYFHHATAVVNLDSRVCHLDFNRGRLAAAKSKYGPKFRVTDPGLLAAVLVSCEADELTIDDIVAEFEIELIDDYFRRSRALRADWGPSAGSG